MTRKEQVALQEEWLKKHKPTRHKPPKKKKHKPKKIQPNLYKTLQKFRGGLKKNATRHELQFKTMLESLDIKFEFQKIFIIKKKGYIADFFLNSYNMVIEIDGKNHATQEYKDLIRTENLLKTNIVNHVLRFENEEVESMNEVDLSRELTLKICPFSEML